MNNLSVAVLSPSTGEQIATLTADSGAQAQQKLEQAWARFNDRNSWLPLHERIEVLERLVTLMERDADDFAMTISA
jgi:acyl-CoA reductase-like NAD-dependent aldehyde dehydrogenase